MKNFIHYFIYIVVPGFVAIICFSLFSVTSNAEALPVYGLDSSAFQVLQGGSNQAINYYGMNDPSSYLLFGIGQQIYNDVDNYLYTNYGYDFQDMGWAMEDSWKDGSVASALADNFAYNIGGFQSMAEAISNGFVVASTYGKSLLTGAKQYIMGKLSGNNITDVKDNIYTKVTDSYINKLNSAASSLKNSDDILDFSKSKIFYSDSFQFSSTFDFSVYNFKFSRPFVLYNSGRTLNNNDTYIGIIVPQSYTVNDYLDTAFGIGTSGTKYDFSYVTVQSAPQGSFVINGVQYATLLLDFHYNFGTTTLHTNQFLDFDINDATNFINTYDPYSVNDISSSYDVSDSVDLSSLLDSLKNTWVTSDDLRRIEDKIDDLTLGNIVIDGYSTPVIDTDNSALTDLQSLIQELLNKNADLSNYLNSLEDSSSDPDPGPDPDPDPYENTGTKVPENLPGIFSPIIETIQVPFSVVSMFEPIFYIFTGGLSNLFSIWLLFPLFILVLLVIWALK